MNKTGVVVLISTLWALAGCGDGSGGLDSGPGFDAGTGSLDSGTGSLDSGTGSLDSGTGSLDSGTGSLDSGRGSLDSGTGSLDSGTADLGVDAPEAPASLTVVRAIQHDRNAGPTAKIVIRLENHAALTLPVGFENYRMRTDDGIERPALDIMSRVICMSDLSLSAPGQIECTLWFDLIVGRTPVALLYSGGDLNLEAPIEWGGCDLCGGRCVDLQTDIYNCGECGKGSGGVHGSFAQATQCIDGEVSCGAGLELCEGISGPPAAVSDWSCVPTGRQCRRVRTSLESCDAICDGNCGDRVRMFWTCSGGGLGHTQSIGGTCGEVPEEDLYAGDSRYEGYCDFSQIQCDCTRPE